jgi:hypothetical protein
LDLEHARFLSTDKITSKIAKEVKNGEGMCLLCILREDHLSALEKEMTAYLGLERWALKKLS